MFIIIIIIIIIIFFLMPIHVVTGAATKVRVSWSGERGERLIVLLEERRQNKSLFHPTMPA